MRKKISSEMWDEFFGNPIISSFLEEAALESVESDDDPVPEKENSGGDEQGESDQGSSNQLEQLIADFQQGNINQDDLINMYKSGNLSKEDIQQIVSKVHGDEASDEESDEPETQEELLAQQIEQTNDMFVKFALYDKVQELTEKLEFFKENFDDMQSGIYDRVVQLNEFLNILSSLIFSIETPIAYQMYGSILLQLTELFDQYNQISQEKESKQQMEK